MYRPEAAEGSNDGDSVMHRRRKFATKARTGCITCKCVDVFRFAHQFANVSRIRRVKCDESKPSCQRCTSTGRKCDGYVTAVSSTRRLMQPSSTSLSRSDAERQALYMFRTKIAASIVSGFDADFWTRDLLQAAEAHETVQYAVAALAAAYRATIPSECSDSVERQFVLAQYTKSIKALSACVSNGAFRSREEQVVVLITNFLFICICALQGSREEACLHLRGGLSLLHSWGLGAEGEAVSGPTLTPVKLLVTMYTQLDTQARVVLQASEPHAGSPWGTHNVALDGWGSGHFEAVSKAFSKLERLHNLGIQERAYLRTLGGRSGHDLHLMRYREQVSLWDSEFGWILRNCTNEGKCSSMRVLRVRRLLAGACLESEFRKVGDTARQDETWCKEIVNLAYQITQESQSQEIGTRFSPAGGLVEALYFVAVNCQDKRIRGKAMDHLRNHPVVEGLWNSSVALEAAVVILDKDLGSSFLIL